MRRPKIIRAIGCLSYLGLLAVIFGLVAYVAFSQFVRRGVTPTPDVGGMLEEDAANMLTDQGLRPLISEEMGRYDERVPAGHVLIQIPSAGTLVKRGSKVTITLSQGPEIFLVPDVIGRTPPAARVALDAEGLGMGRILSIYSNEGRPGTVITQRPDGGSRAEGNVPVDLFLARGSSSRTWVMPDLVGRSFERIKPFLERRGFTIGRVKFHSDIYEGKVSPGTVLDHFPAQGSPLHQGDIVAFTLTPFAPPTDSLPQVEGDSNPESP